MTATAFPDPRPTPKERVAGVPQVDITHAAAAGQVVITAHVDYEGPGLPADFDKYIQQGIAAAFANYEADQTATAQAEGEQDQ